MSQKKTYDELLQKVRDLEDSIDFYRAFIENSSDLFYRTDLAGRITYISPSVYKLSGYTTEEAIGMKMAEEVYLNPEERRMLLDKLQEKGRVKNFEARLKRKDGSIWWASTNARFYKDKDGKILGVAGITRDITELKIAEMELQNREEIYRTIFEHSPLGIFQSTIDGRFLHVNAALAKILGYDSPEDVISSIDNIGEQIYVKTEQRRTIVSDHLSTHDVTHHINHYRRKDGTVFTANLYLRTLFDSQGKPDRFIGIVEDVTERLKLEKDLLEEKERLSVTLRSIGDGVITTDTNGRVMLINEVAEKLTGWIQSEAEGKQIREVFNIIDTKTRKACENPVEKVLEAESITGLANDTNLISRDGTERRIADSGSPIFDASGEIIGVVLVFRDVTERYKIEKQLQQAQKMESIGTLAGGIAHDFNNLLGIITGNVSYALSQMSKTEALFNVLTDVQKGARQAQHLTQQLLTFAKGGEPIKKPVQLNQLVKDATALVLSGTKSKCEFNLANNLWAAEVDPGQLDQVVSNLIINASQAMPNGGTIAVHTENTEIEPENSLSLPAGRYIKISIEDQGIGIPKKHLPNIFDPYFSTKQKGSGLGLATAYSIVRRHGGHITVYSEVEKGTVFKIHLPASLKSAREIEGKKDSRHEGHGKILIMDDQEPILKMAGRMLNLMGYETEFAMDGSEAIEKFREAYEENSPFDLVILDLTIPGGMGGAKTIPELLKIDPKAKAVVSSGYSNDPIMANYEDYGFCGVVPKPYTKDELAKLLNRIFEKNS